MADDGTIKVGTSVDTSGLQSGMQDAADIVSDNLAEIQAQYKAAADQVKAISAQLAQAQQTYGAQAAQGFPVAQAALQQYQEALQQAEAEQSRLAAAMQQVSSAAQEQAAAVESGSAATAQAGQSAASAAIPIFRLYTVAMLVARAFREFDKFRDSEEKLLHFSEATGISAQTLAQFQGAIGLAGGESEKFDTAISHLVRSTEMAERGNARMRDEFSRLGVTTKDPIQAFEQIADTIHNTRDRAEALSAASRVLGVSETDLIGIMSSGSAAIQKNFEASRDLAEARVKALPSAQELTRLEHEFKEALEETTANALPKIVTGIKLLATGFELAYFPVHLLTTGIVDGFLAAEHSAMSFGAVMNDVIKGDFLSMSIDAQPGIEALKKDFHQMNLDLVKDATDAKKFLAEVWKKPDAPEAPGKGKPFAPAASGKDKTQEELKKADEEAFADLQADHQLTIAETIAFWQKRLEIEAQYADRVREIKRTLGHLYQEQDKQDAAEDKKAGEAEITRLVEIDKEITANVKQALGDQFEALKASHKLSESEVIAYWQQVKNLSVPGSALYEEALKKVTDALAKQREETQKLAEIQTRAQGTEALDTLDQQKQSIQRSTELNPNTSNAAKVQELESLKDIDQQIYAEKLREAQAEAQIDQGDAVKYQEDLAKIVALKRAADQQMYADTTKILVQQQASYRNFFNEINQGFTQAINGMLTGQKSFGASMQQLYSQMTLKIIDNFLLMGLRWIEQQLMMTTATVVGNAQRTASNAAAATTGNAISMADSLKQISTSAYTAAANTYASVSAIPVIGPILAPPAAAAAYAGVMAFAAFETGGIVPNTGVALVHKGEKIVDAPLTQMLQKVAANGGAGGGDTHYNFGDLHYHASPGSSGGKAQAQDFHKQLMAEMRKKNLR